MLSLLETPELTQEQERWLAHSGAELFRKGCICSVSLEF